MKAIKRRYHASLNAGASLKAWAKRKVSRTHAPLPLGGPVYHEDVLEPPQLHDNAPRRSRSAAQERRPDEGQPEVMHRQPRPMARSKSSPALRPHRGTFKPLPRTPSPPPVPPKPQVVRDLDGSLVTLDEYNRHMHRQHTLSRLDETHPAMRPPPLRTLRPKPSASRVHRAALEYASEMLADMAKRAQGSTQPSCESFPLYHMEDTIGMC